MTALSPDWLRSMRELAVAARESASRIDPEVVVRATRADEGLEGHVNVLEAFLDLGLADDVLTLLDAFEERVRALERVRDVCTYPVAVRSVDRRRARFVMNGAEVLRAIDQEIPMTLRELMARGCLAVRRLEWPFPNDHLVLDRREDGSYGSLGELRSIAAPEALGMPATSHIDVEPLLDTERWEPYEPKV